MQQAWINIVPGRKRSNAGTTLMRLANYPQLFFHTPPATPFAAANDLYRSLRHHTLSSNLQRALRSQHRHRDSGNARRFPPEGYAAAARHDAAQAQQLQRSANRQDQAADRAADNGNYAAANRHAQAADVQQQRAAQARRDARYNAGVANDS
jgi:hypothetical protein